MKLCRCSDGEGMKALQLWLLGFVPVTLQRIQTAFTHGLLRWYDALFKEAVTAVGGFSRAWCLAGIGVSSTIKCTQYVSRNVPQLRNPPRISTKCWRARIESGA